MPNPNNTPSINSDLASSVPPPPDHTLPLEFPGGAAAGAQQPQDNGPAITMSELVNQRNNLLAQVQALEGNVRMYKEATETLAAEAERLGSEDTRLRDTITKLSEQVASIPANKEALASQIVRLSEENANLLSRVDSLKEENKALRITETQLTDWNNTIAQENDALRAASSLGAPDKSQYYSEAALADKLAPGKVVFLTGGEANALASALLGGAAATRATWKLEQLCRSYFSDAEHIKGLVKESVRELATYSQSPIPFDYDRADKARASLRAEVKSASDLSGVLAAALKALPLLT